MVGEDPKYTASHCSGVANMYNVIVVMSVYNGANRIEKQLDSIFAQIGVNVSIYIRDDNSSDNTLNVIEKYSLMYPDRKIMIEHGENIGYAKSFWNALNKCECADYYAFSDQDDVWFVDKLKKCIDAMECDDKYLPKLSYCRMIRCNETLEKLDEQVDVIPPEKLTKKLTLTQTYNYGAATVINNKARDLICRCLPNVYDIPHDLWTGMLCYWFGKVYFVNEALYYWIRYDNSVTSAGTKKTGRQYRIRQFLNGKSYTNVAKDLLSNYNDLLSNKDRVFLEKIVNYKHCLSDRLFLVLDKDFRRVNRSGTLLLKIDILLGKY